MPTSLPTSAEVPARDASVCFRHVRLPAFPEAVRAARRWARETLEDWQLTEPTAEIQQLVSELLANSIEHARTASVGICLTATVRGSRRPLATTDLTVLIEVSDNDGARLPTRKSPSIEDTSGRGLLIVEELSERWGVQADDHGKTVWCEVAVPRPR